MAGLMVGCHLFACGERRGYQADGEVVERIAGTLLRASASTDYLALTPGCSFHPVVSVGKYQWRSGCSCLQTDRSFSIIAGALQYLHCASFGNMHAEAWCFLSFMPCCTTFLIAFSIPSASHVSASVISNPPCLRHACASP
ncbi:hypothetical protein LAD77_01415 [Klebsiella pneumoniae]|nr:hypothetical protein [Klebsiella pneumoniae]